MLSDPRALMQTHADAAALCLLNSGGCYSIASLCVCACRNTDGIDPDSSSDVLIEDVTVDNGVCVCVRVCESR